MMQTVPKRNQNRVQTTSWLLDKKNGAPHRAYAFNCVNVRLKFKLVGDGFALTIPLTYYGTNDKAS